MAQEGVALVTGAGGFIGHHLVKYLARRGWCVRGADLKLPEFEPSGAHEFMVCDLRSAENCIQACRGVDEIYHLAADMGGISYIAPSHADVSTNNILINTRMLSAARQRKIKRFLFSSSACSYPQYLQKEATVLPLKEDPDAEHGLEKLFTEKLCQYAAEDYGIVTRVVRFQNVYGPLGTYDGGPEKAPAVICRKVAACQPGSEIEIWGDGRQTRSFMYIDDCVEGIFRIMRSNYGLPLNLGTDELVTVDELVDIVAEIAGKPIRKRHDFARPQGVRGRDIDNTRLRTVLGWEPKVGLREGCIPTYRWIAERVSRWAAEVKDAAA